MVTLQPARLAISSIWHALVRARLPIITLGVTYALAVVVGGILVHTGNSFALQQRDALVTSANASDPASLALNQGDRLRAALLDFGGNLLLGGVPSTIAGFAVVIPYGIAGYRGWVGGIVSVDGAHVSRLATPAGATYYLVALILQLIPYTLAGGAGINLGLATLRPRACYAGKRWLSIPVEALRDVGRLYVLIVPLFLIASLWEFFLA
jgi:hypothetical protein